MPKTAMQPKATVVDEASTPNPATPATVSVVSPRTNRNLKRVNGRFAPGNAGGPGRPALTPKPNFRQLCRDFVEMNWETIKLVAIARPQVMIEIMRYGHGPSSTEINPSNEAPALALQLILQLQQHIDPGTYAKIVEAATKLLPQYTESTTQEQPLDLVNEQEDSDADDGSS